MEDEKQSQAWRNSTSFAIVLAAATVLLLCSWLGRSVQMQAEGKWGKGSISIGGTPPQPTPVAVKPNKKRLPTPGPKIATSREKPR